LIATESFFIGASLIHPSFVENADAEGANAPILAIPTKDEPDMVRRSKAIVVYMLVHRRIYVYLWT
jgi:hypothetical protein